MPRIHRPAAPTPRGDSRRRHTLFTTKGFQPTTMEDILGIVGIAKGTLYYHFPSKEQILKALVLAHRSTRLSSRPARSPPHRPRRPTSSQRS